MRILIKAVDKMDGQVHMVRALRTDAQGHVKEISISGPPNEVWEDASEFELECVTHVPAAEKLYSGWLR